MSFGLSKIESVPLSFAQRARIVDLLRDEVQGVKVGEIRYEDNESVITELEEIIDIVNTPLAA